MDFIDRHRRGIGISGAAARHPVGIMPGEGGRALVRSGHHRGGGRGCLGGQRERVGLVRQLGAVRVAQVVLVAAAGLRAQRGGDEQLPDAAGVAQPHRVPRRVPAVEVSDHRDPLRVRRPHGKAHAVDAVHALPLRAQAGAQLEVAALGDQVQVQFAQQQAKGVRVGAALPAAVGPLHAQPVIGRTALVFAWQPRGEDSAAVQQRHLRQWRAARIGQLRRRRPRQADAHQRAVAVRVRTQHGKRVMVAGTEQGLELVDRQHARLRTMGGGHGWSPGASSLRSRRARPLTGRSIHATRLAAS